LKRPAYRSAQHEQKERQIEMAEISPYFAYGLDTWVYPPRRVVGAAMLGAYNLLGRSRCEFSVSWDRLARLLVTMVSSLLFLLILFLKPPGTINLENSGRRKSRARSPDGTRDRHGFGGPSTSSASGSFSDWIGFRAYNPKKLKLGSSIGIALTVWASIKLAARLTFVFS